MRNSPFMARVSKPRQICFEVVDFSAWIPSVGFEYARWGISSLNYSQEMAAYQSDPLISYRTIAPLHDEHSYERPGCRFSSYLFHSHNMNPHGKVNQICEGASPFDDACSRLVRHGDGRTQPGRFVKFAISGSSPPHFVLLFWYLVCPFMSCRC